MSVIVSERHRQYKFTRFSQPIIVGDAVSENASDSVSGHVSGNVSGLILLHHMS